jgi:glycosyltransferase involved in cell wall biosynthesis
VIPIPIQVDGHRRNQTMMSKWVVCQIGAREHYAIPRALALQGGLSCMVTDLWIKPRSIFSRLGAGQRLRERFHSELLEARVLAPNASMLGFEVLARIRKLTGWNLTHKRNTYFQNKAIECLESQNLPDGPQVTLFSYSYAALELFLYAKSRGWKTALGQIDPGPEEERIVAEEHVRYAEIPSTWKPAPSSYWESWRKEIDLADRIVINSDWSRQCLLKEGVPENKLEIVPLVYDGRICASEMEDARHAKPVILNSAVTRVLFLGQINLRKGMGRLLDAMRLLRNQPIELLLVGPSELPQSSWSDLPSVKWLGAVSRSRVANCFQMADVFVLPTLSDGYAIAQLEAMSHGLPVISSRYCGQAVTHGVNGMILEDLKPATIANAMLSARATAFSNVRPAAFGLVDLAKVFMTDLK